MGDQSIKDDEYYGLFYVQNVELIWGSRHWAAGIIVFSVITLLFIKLSLMSVLLILNPICCGILLGPYTAEVLYNGVKKYPQFYAEAGRRLDEMLPGLQSMQLSQWIRFPPSKLQLFWKTDRWLNFISRFFVLGSSSLMSWYFLFKLNAFKYYFSSAALILLPYFTFGCHWLSALWWWKYKIVGPSKYKELSGF